MGQGQGMPGLVDQGACLLERTADLVIAIDLTRNQGHRRISLAARNVIRWPQPKHHGGFSSTQVGKPGCAGRPEVANIELRLVTEIVGTVRYVGSFDGEGGCGDVIGVNARTGTTKVICPVQSGLPQRASDSHAAIIRVKARENERV